MKLGVCHLWGESVETFREELRLSNELGYDIIGIGDSPAGWRELYISMTIAALETDRATITPWVTSPFLRHPLVAASSLATLQSLSGGRIAMGLATGGSNVMAAGLHPATQVEIREYWDALKDLLDGKPATYQGAHVAPLHLPCKTPIYYSAFGPKALKLAGEKADGVIMFTNMDLDLTARKIAAVRQGAIDAGRNPDEVDIQVTAFCSIRPSRREAIDDLKAFIVVNGMAIRTPELLARVPEHLRPALAELQRRYDPSEHVVAGGRNARLLDELGEDLTEYLAGFDTVMGTEAEVKALLDGLENLGVSAFVTNMPGHADRQGNMRALARLLKG
ncbi:MAG: LLM class flavin-dependent oxidoreductase [Porticoccaceae bacterium]|jgi:alkanesulfonate monooxygenase SsuD/methylene tetrahydromethanopterin reductase-like flavin-dependent oxidoreductase (luciferase family)|nr:LLM class flavin-dependent oxidoreductase [Porticoccaceae bacterium]MEA3300922.1 LLM class flavin-dependent oxidoreductase [Pseudomonadota bacterium]HLS97187.1 LLM class flavin-dependent oxidoreductase [Porticoccaceae bacterium]